MGLIHLYSATSTSFDGNGTPLVTAREAVVKRDEGFQLTFSIPISQNELHKRVQKEMIVSAMTPDGINYFRIWDIDKRTTDVKVTALQLLYSLDVKQVNPFGGERHTGDSVLQAFANSFKSSISPYTFSSSIITAREFHTNEEDDTSTSHNALAILNKITDNWSGELMLNGFDVRMISKLGTKTDALLYENKNIASFSDSSSMNGIVTRIYATAKYTPERAEGATEDPEPVVLTATVDSPLINQYAVIYEATMEYNDARTVNELRTEILKQYSEFNVDKPERTIDVDTNIVDGTAINFGDELVLKYLVHDVDEVIRCVGYEYDPISENYIGVTLGTLEKTFLTKVTEGISSSVSRQLDQLNKQIQVVQTAANGKNRVTYGPNPVPNAIEGDLWFKHPEGRPDEIELLVYQNGLWMPAPFLTDQDRADFDQAMSEHYDNALAEIELKDTEYKAIFNDYDEKVVTIDQGIADAATKAQSALEEAGVSTDLAQTAKDLADTARADASTAKTNAQTAIDDAQTAITNATQAKTDAGTALTQAGQAIASSNTAKTNAQTALDNSSTAITNAAAAITKAGQAETTANTAKTNAQTALDDAQSALTEAGSAKSTADALTITVNDLEGEVGLKASKTEVDGISGTVSTHTTTIGQHATAIASKAEKTVVDTLSGTVANQGTLITQNATSITSKAATSVVNAIQDTVDTHTTEISQNATDIATKASTSSVNTLTGRVDTAESDISQNATAITQRVTTATYNTGMSSKENAVLKQSTAPTHANGQLWLDTSTTPNVLKRSNGTAWIKATPTTASEVGAYSQSDGSGLAGRLTTAETNITQTSTAITSKADKSVVDTLSGTVSTHTSTLSQQAKEISARLTESQVNTLVSGKGYATQTWSNQTFATPQSVTTQLQSYAKTTDLNGMVTETALSNKNYITASSVNTLLTNYAKTTDLNGMVTESVLATKQFVTAGTMTTTLSNYAQTNTVPTNNQFNTLKNSYDSMVQTIGTNGSKIAQMVMTDSLFSTTVRESIEVGGRNLVSNSRHLINFPNRTNDTYLGFTIARSSVTTGYEDTITMGSTEAVTGSVYTASFYAKASIASNIRCYWYSPSTTTSAISSTGHTSTGRDGHIEFPITTEWKRYWVTWTQSATTTKKTMIIGRNFGPNRTVEIAGVKLEQGNTATDWTPAPEDKAEQSQVTQLAGSWALTLKSGNDIKTQINASTDSIRLTSKFIHLSGASLIDTAVIKSAHIDTLNANKIVGNTAEFNTIRTGVLVADAVRAAHIYADTVFFDKLFSTTMSTDRLAAREAWIQNANIIGINADKITAGTISANRISTSSLANIQIGGTNLIGGSNGATHKNLDYWSRSDGSTWTRDYHPFYKNSTESVFFLGTTGTSEVHVTSSTRVYVEPNTTYTFSMVGFMNVYVRSVDIHFLMRRKGETSSFTIVSHAKAGIILSSSWLDTVTWTFTTPNFADLESGFIRIDNNGATISGQPAAAYFTNIKLEKGNKATDYSEAPGDIVNDLGRSGQVVIHGGNIKADTLDVGAITGNKATFISSGFKSLNSQSTISGHAIRIQNTAGEFVEMNNTPELRSDDAGGTAVVLGKGRVHFYDSRGHSKGYVGVDMHTAGSHDFGTFLSKGSGIYKFARMADATQTTYAYYTVKAGHTAPSSVITDMVINGYLPDGNAQQFVAKGNMLSELNGWSNYPNWPALWAGQQIRYKELTSQTTGDAYEDIWKFGPSSQGDWRIYFAKHATFEGGTTGTSDRRLKHDIEQTQIEALGHIESLEFKEFRWNRDNKYEPIGLIAQDSGIIRVADDDMEGIDIQRAIMLALKGTQELNQLVKEQAAKIKQLEEINNQ